MHPVRPNPVESLDNLRDRLDRMLRAPERRSASKNQGHLDLLHEGRPESAIAHPTETIAEFLDFMTAALPDGDIYLFGGVLRDLALLGRRGFSSDIDLVVEGNWSNCVNYLESLGARKNKFGGFRLSLGGWPIDIWNAPETWAITQGLVEYRSISSLIETTVLNWDAILMNWRTRVFIHRQNYLDLLRARILDVVLETNPNPLGMLVRVLRHLCLKDARKITFAAAGYLSRATQTFTFDEIRAAEMRSYGNSVVEPQSYNFFKHVGIGAGELNLHSRYFNASELVKGELGLA
jgi:hypothetical protein